MSKKIIIVSKCVKQILPKKKGDLYYPFTFEFHFKGVFAGDLLRKVRLTHIRELEVGKEYLLYVELQAIENGVLFGKIEKVKDLEECWQVS